MLVAPVQDAGQRYTTPGAEYLGTVDGLTNQTCGPVFSFPENRYVPAGAEIDAAVWTPLTTTVEGAGRLRLEARTTSTGERLSAVGLRDDQRGDRCTDLLTVNMRASTAPVPTTRVTDLAGEPACGDAYCAHVYTVAALTDLSTLHGGGPADCHATSPSADQASYVATGEIAPTAFVALSTRVE